MNQEETNEIHYKNCIDSIITNSKSENEILKEKFLYIFPSKAARELKRKIALNNIANEKICYGDVEGYPYIFIEGIPAYKITVDDNSVPGTIRLQEASTMLETLRQSFVDKHAYDIYI